MRRVCLPFVPAGLLLLTIVLPRPVIGQIRPLGQNPGDETPPLVELMAPAGDVTVQYPLITIGWCDGQSALDASSRWIKVNGQTKTSSFSYTAGGWGGDCAGDDATSSTTTVALTVGSNTIRARICDVWQNCTTREWTVNRVAAGPPLVTLKHHNGSHVDRSLCLTLGAGEGAAIQCGDLVVVHGLPGYRTLGRERSLTLAYNSATAVPRALVAAEVTQSAVPASVKAELFTSTVSGWVKWAEATYGGWGGGTRQLALAFDASGLPTAIDSFELRVTNQFAGGGAYTDTVSGALLIVNRTGSEFGSGWHPVGVERLVLGQSGSRILWVGGDGSAVVYGPAGANKWVASPAGYRDTVEWTGAHYVRRLKDRVQVTYDATGRHTQTIAGTGATTSFYWNAGTGRLDSIAIPPAGQSGTRYQLLYDGNGKIDRLVEPTGRGIELTVTNGRLTSAADFDAVATGFAYDGSGRLTGRTNRGNHQTTFGYANGVHVTSVRIPLATADSATTTVVHWDEKGLAVGFPAGTLSAAATDTTYTRLFGPRVGVADDVTYWLDTWGAARSVTDPRGYTTSFTRGDTARPALVTRVQYPDARKLGMVYNARGNVLSVTDSTHEGTGTTQAVTTSFEYNAAANRDAPSRIIAPGGTTVIAYNDSVGLPELITLPGGHQTGFQYLESGARRGLLTHVTEYDLAVVDTVSWTESAATNDLTTQLHYDAWGNDTAIVSPMGYRTRTVYDGYRRVQYAFDQVGHRTDYEYTSVNQVRTVKQYEDLTYTNPKPTQYFYGVTGAIDSVLDPRNVRRSWVYDWAGRATVMQDEQHVSEYRYYDRAGLLDSLRTRLGHVVRHWYDTGGLLWKTKYPATTDPFRSVVVAGDSVLRAYDGMGQLLTASNATGTVTRTYNKEGSLKTELQQVTGGAATFDLRYWYDAANRRTRFSNGLDTLVYGYGVDGRVSTLKVSWKPDAGGFAPDSFRFKWDGLGRRDSVIYTNGTKVGFGYDRDGRLRLLCAVHPNGADVDDYLDHRLRYPSMDPDGMPLTLSRTMRAGGCDATSYLVESQTNVYDGRHQLRTQTAMGIPTTFEYDNSGNLTRKTVQSLVTDYTLLGATYPSNRVREERVDDLLMLRFHHNANGDRIYDSVYTGTEYGGRRHAYYDAIGQMRGSATWIWVGPGGNDWSWVESANHCRYDALGRRIASCGILEVSPWLGFDGQTVVRGAAPEWRYVHGPGVDDPLVAVYKVAYNEWRRYYYLTDGSGRFLAFTDWDGYDMTTDLAFTQNGGNQAGAIEESHTFANGRAESVNLPRLSFYRNRYYDQRTGRWMQEDPIGIAGGVNLYQYAGNNPAMYTDPFGLCPPEDFDFGPDCPGFFTTIGATTGAILGGFGGGAGGAALCAAGGPAAIACAAGGGALGAGKGALWGAAVGAAIDAGIFMASRQADAVERAESLRGGDRGIDSHMEKLRGNPSGSAANHWAGEIRGGLKTVERLVGRMKGETQAQWRRWLEETRRQLDELMRQH